MHYYSIQLFATPLSTPLSEKQFGTGGVYWCIQSPVRLMPSDIAVQSLSELKALDSIIDWDKSIDFINRIRTITPESYRLWVTETIRAKN